MTIDFESSLTGGMNFIAAIVILSVFALKNLLFFIPSFPLYIVCGMLWGPVLGIAIAYVGLSAEISIGYCIGRRLGSTRVEEKIMKKFWNLLSSKLLSQKNKRRIIILKPRLSLGAKIPRQKFLKINPGLSSQ